MKRKISAVLLALGLSVSALSLGVYAAETESESEAAELVTPAETAAAETESEAVEEVAAESEAESEVVAVVVEEEEAAVDAEPETELSQEDVLKANFTQMLGFFDSLDKTQIDAFNDGSYANDVKAFNKALSSGVFDETQFAALTPQQLYMMYQDQYTNWAGSVMNYQTAMQELGKLESIKSVEANDDGFKLDVIYEKTGEDTPVKVTFKANEELKLYEYSWEIKYSFGQLIQQAGMNTLMGVGIVFLTLLFLSWLIGRLHIIPDMMDKAAKKKETPAPAPVAPAPAPAVVEEEELVDDTELVAVIAAAIAAYENTSADGFVVRSIKKSNKRNWQRA